MIEKTTAHIIFSPGATVTEY